MAQQSQCNGVVRHANRDTIESSGGDRRELRRGIHDECQRPRPMELRQPQRLIGKVASDVVQLRDIGQVHDEWVAGRPTFDRKDAGDGVCVVRQRAQAVHRFGRERHQVAVEE